MIPASREELTLGYFASRDFDIFHVDFGIRFDNINSEGSVSSAHEEHHDEDEGHDEDHEEMETSFFDKSLSNSSLAFNFSKSLNDFIDLDKSLYRLFPPGSSPKGELVSNGDFSEESFSDDHSNNSVESSSADK